MVFFFVYAYIIYVSQCPAALHNVPKIFKPISKLPGTMYLKSPKELLIMVHRLNLSVWNVSPIKGTGSWDRFQKFWHKFTEPGLTKGRSWFLNFLEALMIL